MFDLITGTVERPLRKKAIGPKVVSMAVHGVVATLVVVIPLLRVTNTLPEMPVMMAFVASVPEAAPPPPPPPPPPASTALRGAAKYRSPPRRPNRAGGARRGAFWRSHQKWPGWHPRVSRAASKAAWRAAFSGASSAVSSAR